MWCFSEDAGPGEALLPLHEFALIQKSSCSLNTYPSGSAVLGRIHVETFQERHKMRACMIAPTKIIAGLGMSLGMQCPTVPGATGAVLSLACPQQADF